MNEKKRSLRIMRRLCDAIGPEDGIDPRTLRSLPEGRQIHRKTLQVCGQVQRTLREVLAGCGDEVLRELEVVSVSPAAGGGRLLVRVHPTAHADPRPLSLLQRSLGQAAGLLRCEVAAALNRRRAPILVFELLAHADRPSGDPA